jgi:hypothetical protein
VPSSWGKSWVKSWGSSWGLLLSTATWVDWTREWAPYGIIPTPPPPLPGFRWELEDGSGFWVLEDGSGYWELEAGP